VKEQERIRSLTSEVLSMKRKAGRERKDVSIIIPIIGIKIGDTGFTCWDICC
jgi:hypothetical protein